MRKSGAVTVFFSLALVCIFSLMCGLLESARTAGFRSYLKLAADSSMDSVFSRYHREAWEKYRLFLLECKNDDELEKAWEEFMKPYMDSAGWYSMDMEKAETVQFLRITDGGGQYLKQEILDYMKYGIFEPITDEKGAEDLLKSLKEAKAVKQLSGSFRGHERETVRLEKILEDIDNSLKQQKSCWQAAHESAGDCDGPGFRREAERLERETEKIPALVKAYGKKADALKNSISETDSSLSAAEEELSQEVREALNGDTSCYGSYVNQEGERRRKVEALPGQMEQLRQVIEQAKERSCEVESIIDNWDSEDEEDNGPDLFELWGSVGEIWNKADIPLFSYSSEVKDTEKQRLLEQVEGFLQTGLLSLVLPDGKEVSKGVLSDGSFPSVTYGEDQVLEAGLVDRILFGEYCGHFLTSLLSEEDKEVKYELEYLVSGKKTDEENLKQTVLDVLMIREGMNLIHILSDGQKREEAMALAGLITGAVGLAPLTGIVAFFVMSIWALGEAIVDVRMLLEGKKVVFLKSGDSWKLSLEGLLELGRTGMCTSGKEDENGIDYTGYLKLLLFAGEPGRQHYRLMDVIQMNLCRKQADFYMLHCIYQAEIRGMVRSKHMFFGGNNPFYPVEVRTEKAY
jgi:type IV secretory pathway TrbD component